MNPSTHLKKIRILRLFMVPALIAVAASTPAPALATPACGLTTVTLAVGHYRSGALNLGCESEMPKWELEMKVKGSSDVYVIQNTFAPGAKSGWHTHPGPSLITVTAGTLTVYDAADPTCTPKIYTAGQSFTDIGCGDVHLVANEGSVNALAIVVQIVPAGAPRRIDMPQPSNCPLITCP